MSRKINEPSCPTILQFNFEGLTRPKCEVVQHIATKHSASVILLQETHTTSNNNIKVYDFSLIGAIHNPKHGIATLVRTYLTTILVQLSKKERDMQWLTFMISDDISITNIYKPPVAPFLTLPLCQHPAIYSRDFNCHYNPGAIHPTIHTKMLYMTGHIL